MDLSTARIQEIGAAFSRQRLVVIGDVMLDHLIVGDARRISPEAPIPIVNFISESRSPGGAANVARNLAALGGQVNLFGVTGTDASAGELASTLAACGVGERGLLRDPARPTTVKTRITAQRHQVVRLDRETTRPLDRATADAFAALWRPALPGAAAIIITDYAIGVVDQPLIDRVLAAARPLAIPVLIDPKPTRPLNLRGCTALTPNRKETFELAGLPDTGTSANPDSDQALLEAVARVQAQHQPAELLVTLSEAGLLLVEPGSSPRHIPTVARQVFDVTGAGDTVIATFALARAAGATPFEAAVIANQAAGIVVAKTGTATVTAHELLAAFARAPSGA